MQLTYRGSVNRWECDENDHLNVRFCEQKLYQTLQLGLLLNGVIDSQEISNLPAMIARHGTFDFRPSRIAAPLGGYFSDMLDQDFHVLVELRNEVSGVVACSMLCTFADQSLSKNGCTGLRIT